MTPKRTSARNGELRRSASVAGDPPNRLRGRSPPWTIGLDEIRAKKILFDTFWTSKGWTDRDARHPRRGRPRLRDAPRDDVRPADHRARRPRRPRTVAARSPSRSLATASGHFLASLTSRRLDLRSGLASFVLASAAGAARLRPQRPPTSASPASRSGSYRDEDLDVLQFERHKWGGVRHGDPLYTLARPLRARARRGPSTPTDDDRATLEKCSSRRADSAPKDTPGKLSRRLADALPRRSRSATSSWRSSRRRACSPRRTRRAVAGSSFTPARGAGRTATTGPRSRGSSVRSRELALDPPRALGAGAL
jgi:hypothetical protein